MSKPFSPRDLSDDALQLIAARFRTLSEPNRLKLLSALEEGPKGVSELIAASGMKQANVSRHLQTLTEAGLLARERRGSAVIYSIADPGIFELCRLVCGGIQKRLRQQANAFNAQ
jgi:ArsR family transcriptional regulator